MKNIFRKIRSYLSEALSELKKVKWPTRAQTVNLTIAVVLISAFVALLVTAYDLGLLEVRKFILGEEKAKQSPTGQEVPFEIPGGQGG